MSNKSIQIHIDSVKLSSAALTVILLYPMINAGVSELFRTLSLPIYSLLIGLEAAVIFGALFYRSLKELRRVIFAYGIALLLFLLTAAVFPENQPVLMTRIRTLAMFAIPALILARTLETTEYVWQYLHRFSYLALLLGIFYIFSFTSGEDEEYSMWFGYQMTIPSMVILWKILVQKKHRLLNILVFVACCTAILLKGSRGPLIVLVVYFVVCMFKYQFFIDAGQKRRLLSVKIGNQYYSLFRMLILVAALLAMAYFLQNVESVFKDLYKLAMRFGIESRTLRVLSMQNALSYVSGRNRLYEAAIQLIKANPLFGYGLEGDCVQIGKLLGVSSEQYSGMYAHNMVLTFCLHYGVILGVGLLLGYYVLIVRALRNARDDTFHFLLLMLTVFLTVQLMISSTYTVSVPFWLVLGLSLSAQRKRVPLAERTPHPAGAELEMRRGTSGRRRVRFALRERAAGTPDYHPTLRGANISQKK